MSNLQNIIAENESNLEKDPRGRLILEIIGCQKHGGDLERYIELFSELMNDDYDFFQSFLHSSQLRLIEGFREMVREKIERLREDYKHGEITNDSYLSGAFENLDALLSELGDINEIK